MRFDDGIPIRDPSEADTDSPYVAALRPFAAVAFLPTVNIGEKPCTVCGKMMIAYSRRKACGDCYSDFVRATQRRCRERKRAK